MFPNISARFKARDILRTVVCNCCIDCVNTVPNNAAEDDDEGSSNTPSYTFYRRKRKQRKRKPDECADDTSPVCAAILVYNNTQYKCHDLVELERIIRTRIPELYDVICNGHHGHDRHHHRVRTEPAQPDYEGMVSHPSDHEIGTLRS